MQPSDVTIEILKGIRDEVRGINSRLDATNSRLDTLREDTNARFERLERRQAETEVRLATELVAVVGAVHEVRDLLREDRVLRAQVDDHERRLAALEKRPA
jgi:predicted  nucleic acid-binding Zn-ribbon protein